MKGPDRNSSYFTLPPGCHSLQPPRQMRVWPVLRPSSQPGRSECLFISQGMLGRNRQVAVAKQPHGQVSQPWQAGKESAISGRSVHFQTSLCSSEPDVAKETLSAQVSKTKPRKQRGAREQVSPGGRSAPLGLWRFCTLMCQSLLGWKWGV